MQSPLPDAMGSEAERMVFDAVSPDKDVDGLHPVNVGRLVQGRAHLVACTPSGVIELLDRSGITIAGARAVVVRSKRHRRKTHGAPASAAAPCDGDDLSFEDARSAFGHS